MRVILVDESIFTEDIKILHDVLDESLNNFKKLKNGMEEKELSDVIKTINEVSDVLKDLSKKNFQDAKVSSILFDISKNN